MTKCYSSCRFFARISIMSSEWVERSGPNRKQVEAQLSISRCLCTKPTRLLGARAKTVRILSDRPGMLYFTCQTALSKQQEAILMGEESLGDWRDTSLGDGKAGRPNALHDALPTFLTS